MIEIEDIDSYNALEDPDECEIEHINRAILREIQSYHYLQDMKAGVLRRDSRSYHRIKSACHATECPGYDRSA